MLTGAPDNHQFMGLQIELSEASNGASSLNLMTGYQEGPSLGAPKEEALMTR